MLFLTWFVQIRCVLEEFYNTLKLDLRHKVLSFSSIRIAFRYERCDAY